MWKIIVGILLGIGLMVYLGIRGCGESLTQNVLAYGDNAVKSLKEFKQTNEAFRKEVEKTVGKTRSLLNKKTKAGFDEAAEVWERDWDRIVKQFGDLEDRFHVSEVNSNKYFSVLEELANGMVNPDRQKIEKEKNEELKKKWDPSHKRASLSMSQLRSLLVKGSDMHSIILSASLRGLIKEEIIELNEIADDAEDLLGFLTQFADDAKELVGRSH